MRLQHGEEARKDYLLKVAVEFIRENPIQEYTVYYDEATCDGLCLADDIEVEIGVYNDPPKETPQTIDEFLAKKASQIRKEYGSLAAFYKAKHKEFANKKS